MHQHLMETHTQQERIDRILGSMGENRQLTSVTERTVARSTAKSAA
jgi:ferritin-like metal-binding protein YciE